MAADFRKLFWISLVLTLPILALSPLLQTPITTANLYSSAVVDGNMIEGRIGYGKTVCAVNITAQGNF